MNEVAEIHVAAAAFKDEIADRLSEDGECTLGDLLDLEATYNVPVWQAAYALVQERRVYVAVPLSRMDWDTTLRLVSWERGRSTNSDIEAMLGKPDAERTADGHRVYIYDLYVEGVEDGYPSPPQPYAMRDAADEERPDGCNFPFTPIWLPEALQVEFEFDQAGMLLSFEFKVGQRAT